MAPGDALGTDPGVSQKAGEGKKPRSQYHLYGLAHEIDLFEGFIGGIQMKDLAAANGALTELVPVVREHIRKGLEI